MPYVLAGLGTLAFVSLVVLSWSAPGAANLRIVPSFVTASWRRGIAPITVESVGTPNPIGPDGLLIKQLVWSETLTPDLARPYPVLATIDSWRPEGARALATDPHAETLEKLAHTLVNRHWSDLVWLTSLVDQARFDELCATLDRESRLRESSAALSKSPAAPA